MTNEALTFGPWRIEPAERRLSRDGEAVELSGRYLDALLLLARNAGKLVSKDRFMDEVWAGVPVTDEALTQCIRTLRRTLGDEAARPRFIETVPRHGYRFVAEVHSADTVNADPVREETAAASGRRGASEWLLLAAAGLAGGAGAGLIGGIGYGLLAANAPPPGTGAVSIVLVMTCICLLVGALGGLGVGAGIAAARLLPGRRLFPTMLGGALGGLAVGTLGRLVGLDAFALLVGTRPLAITGGSEGLLVGAFAGAAAWLALRTPRPLERAATYGAAIGANAGLLVTLAGGQMMAGSLAVLVAAHPQAPLGSLLGDALPIWLRLVSGAVEGAVFVGALSLAVAAVARTPRG
ncbi:transcriptional regulator [Sphingomonas swuensis]